MLNILFESEVTQLCPTLCNPLDCSLLGSSVIGILHARILEWVVVVLLFSRSVASDSLRPHGLQHTRLPCPSLSPGICSNSCPLSWWCYLTISSSADPLLLLPSIFHSIRVFSNKSSLCIRCPKYWSYSFSISPSNESLISMYVCI